MKIKLVRNKHQIGLFDLASHLSKYYACEFDNSTMIGVVNDKTCLALMKEDLPLSGYDVVELKSNL